MITKKHQQWISAHWPVPQCLVIDWEWRCATRGKRIRPVPRNIMHLVMSMVMVMVDDIANLVRNRWGGGEGWSRAGFLLLLLCLRPHHSQVGHCQASCHHVFPTCCFFCNLQNYATAFEGTFVQWYWLWPWWWSCWWCWLQWWWWRPPARPPLWWLMVSQDVAKAGIRVFSRDDFLISCLGHNLHLQSGPSPFPSFAPFFAQNPSFQTSLLSQNLSFSQCVLSDTFPSLIAHQNSVSWHSIRKKRWSRVSRVL